MAPEVKTFNARLGQTASFFGFANGFQGGASVAAADIDNDGRAEIIIGAGPGGGPNVQVYKANGRKIANFMAYAVGFRQGVYVASCDLNNDGRAEIVTGPRLGGGPNIKVFRSNGKQLANFMAYDASFRGGVTVACGDVTGDGIGDIITGSGAYSGNHVRVFDRHGRFTGLDFWPFASNEVGGVSVGVANTDGTGPDEILASVHRFGRASVKAFRAVPSRALISEFLAFPEQFTGGVNLAGVDLNGDGKDEIAVGANGNGGPDVRIFSHPGKYRGHVFPYPETFRGGVFVAGGDVNHDGKDELITGPNKLIARSPFDIGRRIIVDLSEQRLYAYDNGRVVNTFLVSTGIARYPTPTGDFAVHRKISIMDYQWTYGPEHPDNYDIKDVKWNLNFTTHYYLHTAYWHNNFGHVMSHGCVNISELNAKWLYDWAAVGTTVKVQG